MWIVCRQCDTVQLQHYCTTVPVKIDGVVCMSMMLAQVIDRSLDVGHYFCGEGVTETEPESYILLEAQEGPVAPSPTNARRACAKTSTLSPPPGETSFPRESTPETL